MNNYCSLQIKKKSYPFLGMKKKYIQLYPKQTYIFICLQDKSFEDTLRKGEIARYEHFLLFPQCFTLFGRTFCHFHKI